MGAMIWNGLLIQRCLSRLQSQAGAAMEREAMRVRIEILERRMDSARLQPPTEQAHGKKDSSH